MRLTDKTAVITGAAGILGQASARRFGAEGARLVLVDRDAPRLEALAATLDPGRSLALTVDVACAADMVQVAEAAIDRFGGIDIFFANAGIEGMAAPMQDYPDETFDKVIEVNLRGVYIGVKTMLPRMRDGGSVLMTSSIAGLMGMPLNVAYTASKHAVVGIRRACAAIAGPRGIRVNSIHPGFVDSKMLARLVAQHADPEASLKGMRDRALLGRLVHPDEVANAALFLASDESRGITNHGLVVDCGILN